MVIQSPQIFIVGLTGGIGSGKSQVASRFASVGIHIVNADLIARAIVTPNSPALAAITAHFGAELLDADGGLNRRKLRDIIFNSPAEKHWLESLLHPLINAEIRAQLAAATSPYCILESPLLLETQQHLLVDRILVVDASEALQIERACARDNNTETQIRAIMASQLDRQARCAAAQDIIHNHGSLAELNQQVDKLHRFYLTLAHNKRSKSSD